jgi:elongation factor G
VDEGTTITDFDPEEIERKVTISTGIASMEWNKTKINFLDTPGKGVFIQDARNSMHVSDGVIIVVDAVAGVEVQTEKVFRFSEEFNLPVFFLINKLDRENANFERAVSSVQQVFGRSAIPVQLPLGNEKGLLGVIDLVQMKAYRYEAGVQGKYTQIEVPAEFRDSAQRSHEAIVEMVAEGNDTLLEEFFDKGTIPIEDLVPGLRQAVTERRIFPIWACSAYLNIGSQNLVEGIVNYLPSFIERSAAVNLNQQASAPSEQATSEEGPASAYVFKTLADPFAGRLSFLKVYTGILKNDVTVMNFNQGGSERLAHLSIPQGKTPVEVPELHAGDIGVVAKLKETVTGDTLGERVRTISYEKLTFPEPLISFAIEPKARGDEDKISNALHKILEEDPTLRFGRDQQTSEMLLSGMGQLHIETVVARLKKRFGVDVTLKPPKVPYRETIRGKADVQGRH